MISFASDNNAGVHPRILAAMNDANEGYARAYGDDDLSVLALKQFKKIFGEATQTLWTFNGTGANIVALASLLRPFEAVICADTAHIHCDECGAPERAAGVKLLTINTPNGKLTPALIKPLLKGFGVQHHVQPKAISISQSSEYGTVYTLAEIRALADSAHQHQMLLHMDGARISNAAVHLGCDFQALSFASGVDVLSFGGSKNGLMFGEAVVFANENSAAPFVRKQLAQTPSKTRFIAAQFLEFLRDDLWAQSARHANTMAARLAQGLQQIPGVRLTQSVDANAVFASMPAAMIAALQKEFYFYVWNAAINEVRLMCSFATRTEHIDLFLRAARLWDA
jgi:threonine aldolase